MQANQISRNNSRSGVPKRLAVDELPLKVFCRDVATGSPFTGYLNKQKNLHYYKGRDKGVQVSVSAKNLNNQFLVLLQGFEFRDEYAGCLQEKLREKLSAYFQQQTLDEQVNRKRIKELEGMIEGLEDRFVLNEISREQYDKYAGKYRSEIQRLQEEMGQHRNISSNLEKAIKKGMNIAGNSGCSTGYFR